MEELIIDGIELAIKEEPAIVGAFQALFKSGAPTDQDFADFRASIASKSYADYVPTTLIPVDQQVGRPDGSDKMLSASPPYIPPAALVIPGTHNLTTSSISGS